jgi:hypothetical protein
MAFKRSFYFLSSVKGLFFGSKPVLLPVADFKKERGDKMLSILREVSLADWLL